LSGSAGPWAGALTIRRPEAGAARRLAAVLGPEAAREVPRSTATLEQSDPVTLTLTLSADDTGALRAALNAYLGWIQLALGAEAIARRRGSTGDSASGGAPQGDGLITAPPRRD
jgi:tRNA threonylcarbamoyladenosine modification (KEOPS) complex  Pcc1 subunit